MNMKQYRNFVGHSGGNDYFTNPYVIEPSMSGNEVLHRNFSKEILHNNFEGYIAHRNYRDEILNRDACDTCFVNANGEVVEEPKKGKRLVVIAFVLLVGYLAYKSLK